MVGKRKPGRKASNRLKARRADWDKHFKSRHGFKRPGSLKKNYPHGRAGNPNNTWSR